VIRWTLTTVAVMVLLVSGAALAGRIVGGRADSRASVLVSAVSCWLAAYVLWTMAGGLLLRYGVLAVYDGALFGLVALAGGFVHYRTQLAWGRERALAVFVGAQLVWLVIVLARNGLFSI
jgi:hypothetical protein